MISAVLLGALGLSGLAVLQVTPVSAQRVPGPGPVATGAVYGRVLSAETGEPLAAAAVEVRHRGTFRYLITDGDGAYRATGIAPGEATVVARALDRAPLQAGVLVPSGGAVSLDLRLELRPVLLPAILAHVEAWRLPPPGLTRGGFRGEGETELRALEASPGLAEMGLAGGGRPDPGDPANILYVRGAASDLKLVLLDGAPVYAPFHLGGLLDAFPDGVLERASLYIGGAPARYDGGLSYVLDLEIREGDEHRFRTAGTVDVLGATGRVEGPLGELGRVLVSGRALHGLGYPLVTGDNDLPYGYGDALGRVDLDVGVGHVSATGFWNRESVQLDIGKLEQAGAEESAYWGNASGSVRYRTPLGSGSLTVASAYGRFVTQLPIPRDEVDEPISFINARGRTSRSRTEAFYESGGEVVRWAGGGAFDTHETILDQRTVAGDTTVHAAGRANVAAAWGEAVWMVTPAVELRAGVRADYFEPAGLVRVAPRLNAVWHVSEEADLKLSAGRFHQVVRGPESILSGDLTGPTVGTGTPILDVTEPLGEPALFEVAGASHLVVGLENRLRGGLDLGLEGYFKAFDDLPGATNLYSSGADLWVQATEGPVRGWVGYSLAWVWNEERDADRRFVGRQLLSGGVSSDYRGFDFGVRLAYGAGLPFASVSSDGPEANEADGGGGEDEEPPPPPLSGAPDDSYLRIDAEISRRWVTRFGRSSVEIAPYVRLLNALDRRDALFYRAAGEPTRPVPVSSLPLIAVVGVAWSF